MGPDRPKEPLPQAWANSPQNAAPSVGEVIRWAFPPGAPGAPWWPRPRRVCLSGATIRRCLRDWQRSHSRARGECSRVRGRLLPRSARRVRCRRSSGIHRSPARRGLRHAGGVQVEFPESPPKRVLRYSPRDRPWRCRRSSPCFAIRNICRWPEHG